VAETRATAVKPQSVCTPAAVLAWPKRSAVSGTAVSGKPAGWRPHRDVVVVQGGEEQRQHPGGLGQAGRVRRPQQLEGDLGPVAGDRLGARDACIVWKPSFHSQWM
jgi:hypothetical protein